MVGPQAADPGSGRRSTANPTAAPSRPWADGAPGYFEDLDLDPAAAGFDAVVYGHSHRPALESRDGVVSLNPGSAGPRRFDLPVTLARISVTDGGGLVVEHVDLAGRR